MARPRGRDPALSGRVGITFLPLFACWCASPVDAYRVMPPQWKKKDRKSHKIPEFLSADFLKNASAALKVLIEQVCTSALCGALCEAMC